MFRLFVIFLILSLGFLFASNIEKGQYHRRRKNYIIFATIILILQSGLRNLGVGTDTFQYLVIFENVRESSWQDLILNMLDFQGKDPFYSLFQKCFQIFTKDYQWYLLFVASIFMSSLGYFIYKNTIKISHAMLAFVIYMGNFYGFFSITGTRQTLATAFLLWSFQFIKERKLLYFSIFTFIAGLFHVSAFVFFLLYFLAPIKKPKLIFGISLIGLPLAFIFKNQIAIFFVNFVDAGDRFGYYTEQYEVGGSIVLTVAHVLLGIWGLTMLNKTLSIAPKTFIMFNTFALALFFFPLQWVNPSAGRIAQYFTVIMMVWIPYLLDAASIGSKKARELLYVAVVLILILFTMFAARFDNYRFFWQYMEMPAVYR
jgi:hypothetical protein